MGTTSNEIDRLDGNVCKVHVGALEQIVSSAVYG